MSDQKRCCTCKELRPLEDYNVRRSAPDGRQSRCRDCSRVWYAANRVAHGANVRRRQERIRQENKAGLGAYLAEHPCVDCGEADVRVLDLDHDGLLPKRANVGNLLASGVSWERIEQEISACSVRCANCHRRVTSDRAEDWRHRWATAAADDETARARDRLRHVLS